MAEPRQLRLVVPPSSDGAGPRRALEPHPTTRPGMIVAVGGGKGGVGKSLVAASVGIDFARRGQRVVLVDCDLGGANLHTSLGLLPPRQTLSDFVRRRRERIEDVVVPTGIPNLSLLSGALDGLDAANPNHAQKMRLVRQLRSMDADVVVLDLAAGTAKTTLDFFLLADQQVLVVAPEFGAVENAHRFVKAAFMRRMRTVASLFGVADLLGGDDDGRFEGPAEILDAMRAADAETYAQIREQVAAFRPGLVVNQARSPEDAELGQRIAAAWWKGHGIGMRVLGTVQHDDEVWRAARERRPLLLTRAAAPAARALSLIASRIRVADAVAMARR